MMRVIAPAGLVLTDPQNVTDNLYSLLGEHGVDPESAFQVATMMMMAAVQAEEPPEQTVVQSFVVGIAVGLLLRDDPV